jgi:hypothetical protein
MNARRPKNGEGHGCRNRRAMLMRWIDSGGPLSDRLARHLTGCPSCLEWADRIVGVQGALAMLSSDAAPVGIHGRANDKALRMLVRGLRDGKQAAKLRSAKPTAGLWTKLEGPASRATSAAAAAMILLALRAGIEGGLQQTRDWAQPLADIHYQRHIDDQGMLS